MGDALAGGSSGSGQVVRSVVKFPSPKNSRLRKMGFSAPESVRSGPGPRLRQNAAQKVEG